MVTKICLVVDSLSVFIFMNENGKGIRNHPSLVGGEKNKLPTIRGVFFTSAWQFKEVYLTFCKKNKFRPLFLCSFGTISLNSAGLTKSTKAIAFSHRGRSLKAKEKERIVWYCGLLGRHSLTTIVFQTLKRINLLGPVIIPLANALKVHHL